MSKFASRPNFHRDGQNPKNLEVSKSRPLFLDCVVAKLYAALRRRNN
jgi:hypothetical protein